eukprot:2485568-Rhodomonas_salina.3
MALAGCRSQLQIPSKRERERRGEGQRTVNEDRDEGRLAQNGSVHVATGMDAGVENLRFGEAVLQWSRNCTARSSEGNSTDVSTGLHPGHCFHSCLQLEHHPSSLRSPFIIQR